MRNEELYALLRTNVDLERRLIFVRHAEPRVVRLRFALPCIDTWDPVRPAEMRRNFAIGLGLPPVYYHYLRLSGVDIRSSTDALNFHSAETKQGTILSFQSSP